MPCSERTSSGASTSAAASGSSCEIASASWRTAPSADPDPTTAADDRAHRERADEHQRRDAGRRDRRAERPAPAAPTGSVGHERNRRRGRRRRRRRRPRRSARARARTRPRRPARRRSRAACRAARACSSASSHVTHRSPPWSARRAAGAAPASARRARCCSTYRPPRPRRRPVDLRSRRDTASARTRGCDAQQVFEIARIRSRSRSSAGPIRRSTPLVRVDRRRSSVARFTIIRRRYGPSSRMSSGSRRQHLGERVLDQVVGIDVPAGRPPPRTAAAARTAPAAARSRRDPTALSSPTRAPLPPAPTRSALAVTRYGRSEPPRM